MKLQGSPSKERQEKYQYVSTVSQQYGEDFWRLKAERMTEAVEQVKSENVKLNQRCVEMGRVEQELRENIATYEDDWKKRSRRMTTERVSDKFQEIY